MTPSEKHNQLAREFTMKVGRETTTASELMVVSETMILSVMMLLTQLHGVKPSTATGLVEAAIYRAIERFTEAQK